MKPVSRASGRSAVASAAYRAGEKLTNERDGITHDFTRKEGVEHCEIVLPEGVSADWALDRSALWNAAEFAEKRKDARVAREFEIALPHELLAGQRLEATRDFAQDLANRYGAAVDFAIHAPHEASDVRNHHAHLLMTTRQVAEDGPGDKTCLERENKWLLAHDLPTTDMQLRDLRQRWEGIANERLAMAGLDIRIDHRSHMERGLEIAPTGHMGVHATQMQRKGTGVERARLDRQAAQRNAALIREKPEQVLTVITGEKSVFDRRDVARALHRYINDDAQEFQSAFAKVMASPALVELQAERAHVVGDPAATGEPGGQVELARYSTREMVEIESGMVASAGRMHQARSHGVDRRHVERAMERQDAAIQRIAGGPSAAGTASAWLSDEQLQAIGVGAPFRAITEEIGHAGLSEIRRQREDWQRAASVAFATHKTAGGLSAYREHGNVSFAETGEEARGEIVRDYLADRAARPDGSRVAMAHRRADVRALNAAIRAGLQDRGELGRGAEGGELTFRTNDGKRAFAPGARIVFLENDRDLGVKNGMPGTVEAVERYAIRVRLDGWSREGDARLVNVPVNGYQSLDHGYATTIHKNQGATVDRSFVLASGTMDRHLTYVAMTRHRDGVQLHAVQDEFADRPAGQGLAADRAVRAQARQPGQLFRDAGNRPWAAAHDMGRRAGTGHGRCRAGDRGQDRPSACRFGFRMAQRRSAIPGR